MCECARSDRRRTVNRRASTWLSRGGKRYGSLLLLEVAGPCPPTKELVPDEKNAMNVAMLLSCGSFDGFFGWVQGQSWQVTWKVSETTGRGTTRAACWKTASILPCTFRRCMKPGNIRRTWGCLFDFSP